MGYYGDNIFEKNPSSGSSRLYLAPGGVAEGGGENGLFPFNLFVVNLFYEL